MHRLLKRQLERLGLGEDTPPGAELWRRLLGRISASYTQSDEARQLSERAMEISSREMLGLHERERKANEQLEERVRERTVELAQAEQAARESEARFRSLTELSSDWFWEIDKDLRLTSLKGRTLIEDLQSVMGKRREELPGAVPDAPGLAAYLEATAAHRPFRDLVYERYDAGVRHFVSISGEPVFDERGAFLGFRGTGRNVTELKRGEQLLRLEHTVTSCLASAESASAALTAVLRAMCESEGWDCARFFRVDEKRGVLRFDGSWSIADPGMERHITISRGIVVRPGEGLAGRVWDTGQPLWSTNAGADPRVKFASLLSELGIKTTFMFPVMSEGRVIGVVGCTTRATRAPDERLLRAVHAIGAQIGQFLERKKADEKVRTQALQQRLIAEFGQQALASAELSEVLKRASMLVAQTLDTDFSSVLELAPDRLNLIFRAAVGWPEEWISRRVVPVGQGSRLQHTLSRKEPLVVEDYRDQAGFVEAPLFRYGVRSGVQVPVFGPREIFGVLSVHTVHARHFSDDDVSFLRSVANILAIAIERKSAEDKLAHLAQFDPVTGLPNRHLFRDRLGQCLTQAQRNGWLGGVLFVDLDRFKAVNDTFGHSLGDNLLRQVASRIKECVRGGDTVARLSGDEFAVVMSHLGKIDDAGLVAQKIVDALAAPFDLDGHQTYISASIGIAVYPADGTDPDMLVKNADTAMYRAKEQGRNCYQYYLPQMNERLMKRLQLESRLRGALDRQEFRLHYQPKVQLDSGAISGFEALLRWEQDGKLVPPAEFIPILEDTGLIVPVGEWVLRNVCEQIRRWKDQGVAPRPVAVNLSPRQFQHRNLVLMVETILRDTGVRPEFLELELTETLLMTDAEDAIGMLRDLKGLGVGLAVDDFGTGYSSLAYLKRFPLDTLKIDRAFIRDAASNPDDATLALTIINLAHSMRLKVVAEGVETEDQLSFLRRHGCDEMQGFYFARPLEATACTQALVEDRRLQPPSAAVHALPSRNRDTDRLRA